MHFNARSILRKWDVIIAEIDSYAPDIICISETWITDISIVSNYSYRDFIPFFSVRNAMLGGGTLLLINPEFKPRGAMACNEVTVNNAFNVCAALVGRQKTLFLIAAVYRAPWASVSDFNDLLKILDKLVHNNVGVPCVFVGDFNMPHIDWVNPTATVRDNVHDAFQAHVEFNDLDQLVDSPTRNTAILDIVLASSALHTSSISIVPPIGDSDHLGQLFTTLIYHLSMS